MLSEHLEQQVKRKVPLTPAQNVGMLQQYMAAFFNAECIISSLAGRMAQ
jgi:hypothetical protein